MLLFLCALIALIVMAAYGYEEAAGIDVNISYEKEKWEAVAVSFTLGVGFSVLWLLVLFCTGQFLVTGTVVFTVQLTVLVAVISFYIGSDEGKVYGYVCGVFWVVFAGFQVAWFCASYYRIPLTAVLIDTSVAHLTENWSTILMSLIFATICFLYTTMVFWSIIYNCQVFDEEGCAWLTLFQIPMLFWGLSVLLNIPNFAASTSMFFWCRNSDLGNISTLIGLKRAFTRNLGSICVGAGHGFNAECYVEYILLVSVFLELMNRVPQAVHHSRSLSRL